MTKGRKREVASWGEDVAARYFAKRGATIIARNWRLGRFAELDLVCQDEHGLVIFVEVKTRQIPNHTAGFSDSGFSAINRSKQVKMTTAARSFLARARGKEPRSRFDAVIVYYKKSGPPSPETLTLAEIHHIEAAFVGTDG